MPTQKRYGSARHPLLQNTELILLWTLASAIQEIPENVDAEAAILVIILLMHRQGFEGMTTI